MSFDTMEAEKDGVAIGVKLGAARERRRIRRAQRYAVKALLAHDDSSVMDFAKELDAATKTPKKDKRKC